MQQQKKKREEEQRKEVWKKSIALKIVFTKKSRFFVAKNKIKIYLHESEYKNCI